MHNNDWMEYKRLFIDFKRQTEEKLDNHDKKLDRILESMGGLKAKVAVGSLTLAGIISYIVSSLK